MMLMTIISIKISCLVTGHRSKLFVFIFVYPQKLILYPPDVVNPFRNEYTENLVCQPWAFVTAST
jgi:hypothetical protein